MKTQGIVKQAKKGNEYCIITDHLLCKILLRHFLHNFRRITAKSVISAYKGNMYTY